MLKTNKFEGFIAFKWINTEKISKNDTICKLPKRYYLLQIKEEWKKIEDERL